MTDLCSKHAHITEKKLTIPIIVTNNNKHVTLLIILICTPPTVFSSCAVTYDDRVYRVKHGKSHFDRCNCRVCTCYFGELYCEDSLGAGCRSSDKCSNSSVQSSCALQNGTVTLEHGESVEDDCNRSE